MTPKHVWVYGNDHSPWVQAVLLGLHQSEIAHTLVTVPPLSVFLNSGVLMPAARIDDGEWLLDSERILVELGFSEVEESARRALMSAFLKCAMRRADHAWGFWHRFSLARDEHPVVRRRVWNQFLRAFSIFYFFTLISLGRRGRPVPTSEQFAAEFSSLQTRLVSGAAFFGGDAPNTLDLQLFGLVQMCASIPGSAYTALRLDPSLDRLRGWVGAMQREFSDYGHLYSAQDFAPQQSEIERAPGIDRIAYWCGAALMWIAFPISLLTTFYFVQRVRKEALVRS